MVFEHIDLGFGHFLASGLIRPDAGLCLGAVSGKIHPELEMGLDFCADQLTN